MMPSTNNADNTNDNERSAHSLKLTSPTQQKGSLYEQFASLFLQQAGMTLIAQNWLQPKVGELDLVMLQSAQPSDVSGQHQSQQTHWQAKVWDTLVFVEVKVRIQPEAYVQTGINDTQPYGYGDAMTSVTASKQKKLVKTANHFLQQHPEYHHCECRFDVVAFNLDVSRDRALQRLLINKTGMHCPSSTKVNADGKNLAQLDWTQWLPYINWVQGAFLAQAW